MADIRRWNSRGWVWLTLESRVASHCSSHAHLNHFPPKLSFRSDLLRCDHFKREMEKISWGMCKWKLCTVTHRSEERLKYHNEDILAGILSGRAKYPFPINSLNKLFIFIIYTHLSKLLKRSTEVFLIKYVMYVQYAYLMFQTFDLHEICYLFCQTFKSSLSADLIGNIIFAFFNPVGLIKECWFQRCVPLSIEVLGFSIDDYLKEISKVCLLL